MRKHFTPSSSLVAFKNEVSRPEVIEKLFAEKVIAHENYEVLLYNNRFNDENSLHLILYNLDLDKLEIFCKISRGNNNEDILH